MFDGRTVLRRLRSLDYPRFAAGTLDPAETLIKTILSQRTTYVNTARAYAELRRRGLASIRALAEADVGEIMEAIRVAGLYRQRARALKRLAAVVMDRYGGDLRRVLSKPIDEARRELLMLPGVGYKTADILLLFSGGKPVFPVDTHVWRISVRWGLVGPGAGYEDVRGRLEAFFPRDPQSYLDAHLGMIALGRRFCRAGRTLCGHCVLRDVCPYSLNIVGKSV